MGTITERIAELIGDQSSAEFARRCGITDTSVRQYRNGTTPSVENLIAIAKAADVRLEWLATGRGPKFHSDSPQFDGVALPYIDIDASAGHGRIISPARPTFMLFPKNILTEIDVPESHAKLTRAVGSSMEPTICDGDLLLIDASPDQKFADTSIFVFTIGDEAFVKRTYNKPGVGWEFVSDNSKFAPVPFPKEDHVAIIGRVRWTGREL